MKKQSKWHSFLLNILIGAGVSCVILILLISIVTLIGTKKGLSDTFCTIIAYSCVFISWAVGGFFTGLRNRKDGLLLGAAHGICLLLLLLAVSLIVHGSEMKVWSTKFLIYFLGGPIVSGIGSIIGVHFALKKR